nr:MAG TPA: hypothetical protein [Caudoviricetes sp.]
MLLSFYFLSCRTNQRFWNICSNCTRLFYRHGI